jgi:predicted enzyme related to lactoylglutathione lyase
MSRRDHYPAGVPCFVDTLTADVGAARRFYGGVFGWEFTGPGQIPGDPPGDYYVAQSSGADVAGLGSLPGGQAPPPATAWNTHISVQSADDAADRAQAAGGTVVVAPASAAPAGRIAVLSDPAGAVFCVWEAGERAGAGRVNEPSAWAMSMLATDDPARAVDFYGELFGWQAEAFAAAGADFWLWRLPGFVGGEPEQPVPRDVVAAMRAQPGPARWDVDFWIADADAAAVAATELGGSVLSEPIDDPPFRRAVLADPAGAAFSVSQLRPGG